MLLSFDHMRLPFSAILHAHEMAKTMTGFVDVPPFPVNADGWLGRTNINTDLSTTIIRDQRMSGIAAALWGDVSGLL